AAQAKYQAGAPDAALGLLASAQAGPLDELQRARADLLRAQIAFAVNRGSDAPPLLLTAAKRLEPLDVGLARETYLEALQAAMFVGRLATGDGLLEVAQAARGAPPSSQPPRPADLLLDGLALLITEGHPAGAPMLKRALRGFRSEQISSEEGLRWLWLACLAAVDLWDHETWDALSTRHVQLARDAGALTVLPIALISRMAVHLWAGELAAAAALIDEVEAVTDATGSHLAPYGALGLAAWRGRKAEAAGLIEARSRALLSDGEAAERLYREAIDCLGRTRVRVELARAHLLYGEWLRRERRRLDARQQLRTAHDLLSTMGMEGFAEHAARELLATGETARKRSVETSSQLTAQEAQVARLARDGLSNPEIGARLFISTRTVQYHLGKVFTKLGINSRVQLARALPSDRAGR